jgi:hypothetical protein
LKENYFNIIWKNQKMFEKNHLAKAAEEEEKQGRRRTCEEAKQQKKKKVPKRTATRKLFKVVDVKVECSSVCHICKRRIKRVCVLRCDDCQNLYNELCIPKYHKKHIQISEDGDTILSQLLQRRKHKQCRRNDKG